VLLFRLLGLLVAVALGSLVLMYLTSGERRYLGYAWRLFRYSLFLAVFVLILIFAERLVDQF
jgi:hypothetical protein